MKISTVNIEVKLKKELEGKDGMYFIVINGEVMLLNSKRLRFTLPKEDWYNKLNVYFNLDQASSIKIEINE